MSGDLRQLLSAGIPNAGYAPGQTMTLDGAAYRALEKVNVSVALALRVMNATKYNLYPEESRANGGVFEQKSEISKECGQIIKSGEGEIVLARKRRHVPTGSYGSIAFRIGRTKYMLVIGWCIPYFHLFYSNCMMIGIAEDGEDAQQRKFHKLYRVSNDDANFGRKDFPPLNGLRFTAKGFHLMASMEVGYKAVATVTIVPESVVDLAKVSRKFVTGDFDTTTEEEELDEEED